MPSGASATSSPRDRLLETAFELFYRHGVNSVGIDRVLAESGVSKATLYRHFPTKDDLITAYVRLRDERYRDWMRAEVESRSAADRPMAVFDALEERSALAGFRGCAFGNVIADLADPDHPAHAAARDHKEAMRAWLTELLDGAGYADPQELARQLLLVIDGAMVTAARGGAADPVASARRIAGVLLDRG